MDIKEFAKNATDSALAIALNELHMIDSWSWEQRHEFNVLLEEKIRREF